MKAKITFTNRQVSDIKIVSIPYELSVEFSDKDSIYFNQYGDSNLLKKMCYSVLLFMYPNTKLEILTIVIL